MTSTPTLTSAAPVATAISATPALTICTAVSVALRRRCCRAYDTPVRPTGFALIFLVVFVAVFLSVLLTDLGFAEFEILFFFHFWSRTVRQPLVQMRFPHHLAQ